MKDNEKRYTYLEIMAIIAPNSVPCAWCGRYHRPENMFEFNRKYYCTIHCARADQPRTVTTIDWGQQGYSNTNKTSNGF